MRVVIVDDEMLERKAMRKFLQENFNEIEVVGEASNGRTAIELAQQLNPDLMLMDIKMPGISGIDTIKNIRKTQPSIKFIMVSAYDSFKFAKKAMNEGVREYLLKPSKKEEAIKAITRVCREIKDEQATCLKQKKSLKLEKENFLLKILQYDEIQGMEKQQKELFPKMKYGFFFVMEIENEVDLDRLKQKIDQYSPFQNITVQNGNHVVSLFICMKEQGKLDSLLLAKKIQSEFLKSIWIGIGYSYPNIEQLHKSYQEALQTLHILKKEKRIQHSLPILKKQEVEGFDEEELFICLFQGNFYAAWQLTKDRLDQMDRTELYVRIREKLIHEGILIDHLFYPEDHLAWREFIQNICLKVLDFYHSNDPIERAKKYISQHFHEAITLEQVSEHVSLSPTYFTKLFRERTETTFIDYLTEVRLMKAKQLLIENKLILKEICYEIGYNDPNYFSRVFKKRFNKSPKQFQKNPSL